MSVEDLEAMVRAAGMEPVERDSHYNVVSSTNRSKSVAATATPEREPECELDQETRIEQQSDDVETSVVEEESIMIEKPEENKDMSANDDLMSPESQQETLKTTKTTKGGAKSGDGALAKMNAFYRRIPILSHIFFIGIFCMLLVVCLYFGLKWGTRHNNTIVVPDFIGMSIEDARSIAQEKELNIVVRDSIFDVDLPGGTIVDQLPGTSDVRDVTVKPGRKIYVTINAYNRRQVQIPYVAKQTLRQALNQIERSGFTVEELIYQPNMTSTDYVERQMVGDTEVTSRSHLEMPVGTGITLYVNYQRENSNTVAPRVVGLSLAKAKSSLWDHGFNVGEIIYDESVGDIIDRRKARVYKQSVKIGSSYRRGTEVDLYLTTDDALVDSLRVEADKEMNRAEAARRKAQQEAEAKLKDSAEE